MRKYWCERSQFERRCRLETRRFRFFTFCRCFAKGTTVNGSFSSSYLFDFVRRFFGRVCSHLFNSALSRQLKIDGQFYLKNVSEFAVSVNNMSVPRGRSCLLPHLALIRVWQQHSYVSFLSFCLLFLFLCLFAYFCLFLL